MTDEELETKFNSDSLTNYLFSWDDYNSIIEFNTVENQSNVLVKSPEKI